MGSLRPRRRQPAHHTRARTHGEPVFFFLGGGVEPRLSEGGFFKARLSFPKEYPQLPPKMKFTSEMWHPNGASCSPSQPPLSPSLTHAARAGAARSSVCSLPRRHRLHLHLARPWRGQVRLRGRPRAVVAGAQHPRKHAGAVTSSASACACVLTPTHVPGGGVPPPHPSHTCRRSSSRSSRCCRVPMTTRPPTLTPRYATAPPPPAFTHTQKTGRGAGRHCHHRRRTPLTAGRDDRRP